MPLPRIPSVQDIVVPAREEKVFTDGFMKTLIIQAPSPTDNWSAAVEIIPYNYETGEFPVDKTVNVFKIQDLKAESARSPLIAQIFGGVLTGVGLLVSEQRILTSLETATTLLNQKLALLNQANTNEDEATQALADANALPENDPNKQDAITNAEAALAIAQTQLTTATTEHESAQESVNDLNTALASVRTQLGID